MLYTAGCSDPSYEDITAILASSDNTQAQDLASVCAGPAASDLQPAVSDLQPAISDVQPTTDPQPIWNAGVTDLHSTDSFPARLLEEGSISQTDAGLMDDSLVSEKSLTSLAAAGEAATLSGSIVHSDADPSRLCLQPHSTSSSSMSSKDSSQSTCSHSSTQLSVLNEGPSAAAGQWADAPGAVPRASGLLQKGDFRMQGAQAAPAGLSAEPIIESMLVSPTCPSAEHSGCDHQTVNPAQQTPEKLPTLPLGSVADSNQRVSVHQIRAGLQTQRAGSEMQKTEGSSQQPHAQAQSADTTIPGGETDSAAASSGATPAGGNATPAEVS